ncbi:MAG TPA: STAS domain-containing protein [Polyangiaceae bacterium]|nr:STAS domain-containing protein [Polyangiaceae bacterium]
MTGGGSELGTELGTSIGEILAALRAIGDGSLKTTLSSKYPESHPVGALVSSINYMAEALREAREKSAASLAELDNRITTIERQREAIRNLSVPIIEIWAGVLCVPVVGVLDSARAADVTTTLLGSVVEKKSRFVIIDVTGVEVMDTSSADHFLRIARAVTLLGARCLLSGMHPNVARTIVAMGVELHGLRSYRNMRDALKQCVIETNSRPRQGRLP